MVATPATGFGGMMSSAMGCEMGDAVRNSGSATTVAIDSDSRPGQPVVWCGHACGRHRPLKSSAPETQAFFGRFQSSESVRSAVREPLAVRNQGAGAQA